jgi:hypothetical protein
MPSFVSLGLGVESSEVAGGVVRLDALAKSAKSTDATVVSMGKGSQQAAAGPAMICRKILLDSMLRAVETDVRSGIGQPLAGR